MSNIKLPPFPPALLAGDCDVDQPVWGADHLADYAIAAIEAYKQQQGEAVPFAWHVCSVNKDGSLSLEFAAAWQEAAHEHINNAIAEHGIEEAATWVVRPAYNRPAPAQQPLSQWVKTTDQMPPEGVRVFWLDQPSNRVGFDTYMGEGYSWAASHWMHIPPVNGIGGEN